MNNGADGNLPRKDAGERTKERHNLAKTDDRSLLDIWKFVFALINRVY